MSHSDENDTTQDSESVQVSLSRAFLPNCDASEGEEEAELDQKMASLTVTNEVKKMATPMPFPQTLMEILSNKDYSEIIAWLPHGKSFMVYDKNKFIEVVSPCYFQETKFESFLRKLNRWGFIRISKGFDCGAFYHKHFLRDEPQKCKKIQCKKYINKTKLKNEASKEFKVPAPSSASPVIFPQISMDSLKMAQMEQTQRSYLLKYLHIKQQYEQSIKRETLLRAQLFSQHQELMKEYSNFQSMQANESSIASDQSVGSSVWPPSVSDFGALPSSLSSSSLLNFNPDSHLPFPSLQSQTNATFPPVMLPPFDNQNERSSFTQKINYLPKNTDEPFKKEMEESSLRHSSLQNVPEDSIVYSALPESSLDDERESIEDYGSMRGVKKKLMKRKSEEFGDETGASEDDANTKANNARAA